MVIKRNRSNIQENYIWINGKFKKATRVLLDPLTHSLHYAGAVFEGERAYSGNIFKLEEHSKRLLISAEYMSLNVDYSLQEIMHASNEILIKNALYDNVYIRPIIWRGSESLNIFNKKLTTNIMIIAIPMQQRSDISSGLNLNIGKWRKPHPDTLPVQSKSSAHYAMSIISKKHAQLAGYDDSLLLDVYGNVAECTVTNIFFGIGNVIVTPIADRFLNGITRQTVIELARSMGIIVEEKRITLEDLEKYDTCFVTGTATEIKFVSSINYGDKKIVFYNRELVSQLQNIYTKLVHKV